MRHEITHEELLETIAYPALICNVNGGNSRELTLKNFIARYGHEGWLATEDLSKEEQIVAATFLSNLTKQGYAIVKVPVNGG